MPFNRKKYPKSKDARRRFHTYHDSRDFDGSCRSGGSCSYCENGRLHKDEKRKRAADERLREDLP